MLEFDKQYLMDVIRTPTYRYGQAFLNHFVELDSSLTDAERMRLWEERDWEVAQKHILYKWVQR
jgi:hypothetical protein